MQTSIVIPLFNKSGLTRVCLNALARTLPNDGSCEVIIVDNHSSDDTPLMLREFPWVRIITNEQNRGFAAANNQGAAVASGKYLVLLNNDTEPQSGWLQAMLRCAEEERAGVVGAKLLFSDRKVQHAGCVVAPFRFGPYRYVPYHYLWSDPENHPAVVRRKQYQVVTGACLLTPRALYLELGGLDETFWNGYEDVDYCFKVLRHGERVFYEPRAVVTHFESQSGPLRFSRVAYNSTLLAQRWPDFPKMDHVEHYLEAGNVRRNVRIPHGFSTLSFLAPKSTILIHGTNARAELAAEIRNTVAPIEKILWAASGDPPAFSGIPVVRASEKVIDAAREEMELRGDRYLVFLDAQARLQPRWLDHLIQQAEWGPDVIAATTAPELPPHRERTSLAADARCTVLRLSTIPQHEHLREFDTLSGSLADLTLRFLSNEYCTRAAAEPVAELPALQADAAFEKHYGAPVSAFLRTDLPYVERLFAERTRRPLSELRASIIMLSWNAPQYTKIALESIRAHTKMAHEIIIVDNGSGIETTDWLRTLQDVTVIFNPANRGFAAGNNQGISAAGGDYIVLLNNDVVVTDGWLERMVDAVEREPGTGVSAPRSNEIAGDQKLLNLQYASMDEMHAIAAQRSKDYARDGYFTDRAIGFCLCIDRRVIEQVGGIDEQYGTGNFEDDDFCMRVRAAGYRIYVCNDVFIHHFGSVSFAANSIDYASTMTSNWTKFARKWGYPAVYPQTGYRPLFAIRGGFKRDVHYVKIPGFELPSAAADNGPGDSKACRLLIAAAVRNEDEWNVAATFLRRCLSAFGSQDSVTIAIACTADLSAETLGARVEKMIEKLRLAENEVPDVLISDETDVSAFVRGIGAIHGFEIVCGPEQRLPAFEPLTARSPSDLRRLYAGLRAPAAAPA